MSYTFVAASSDTGISGSYNIMSMTLAVPTGTLDGDLLLMAVQADAGSFSGNHQVVDAPAGWTVLGVKGTASGSNSGVTVLGRIASSEPASYTFNTKSNGFGSYCLTYAAGMCAYRGPMALDVTSLIAWATTGKTTPSGTGTDSPQIHFAIWATEFSALGTVDAAVTERVSAKAVGGNGIKIADEFLSGTAVPARTMVGGGSMKSVSIALGFTHPSEDGGDQGFDEYWDVLHGTGSGDSNAGVLHHPTHEDQPMGGDNAVGAWAYTQDFTAASTIVVPHNLGGHPRVTVEVGGDTLEGEVTYDSANQLTVRFSAAQTGRVQLS